MLIRDHFQNFKHQTYQTYQTALKTYEDCNSLALCDYFYIAVIFYRLNNKVA